MSRGIENIILGREPRDCEKVAQFFDPANFGGGAHARFQAPDIKVEGRASVFDNLIDALHRINVRPRRPESKIATGDYPAMSVPSTSRSGPNVAANSAQDGDGASSPRTNTLPVLPKISTSARTAERSFSRSFSESNS